MSETENTASGQQRRHLVRLRLENFQDHRDTDIRFRAGINLITGSSDAGKSAILRGLNFIFHNQPRGDSFIRRGANESRVTVWFSDGAVVQRIKERNGRNAIMAQTATGERINFEKFGTDIPAEIAKVLGNPPIDSRHGPLAYAEQMAPYFLVSLSPMELPRCISELTGIQDFEEAAAELGKRSRQSGNQVKTSMERVEGYNRELGQYADVDRQLDKLAKLEVIAEKVESINQTVDKSGNLIKRYNELMDTARKARKALTQATRVADLALELTPAQECAEIINKGQSLLARYKELMVKEFEAERRLIQVMAVSNPDFEVLIAQGKELQEKISQAQQRCAAYEKVMAQGRLKVKEHNEWSEIKNAKEKERNTLIEEMRAAGIWCDNCDRPAVGSCEEDGAHV